MLTFVKEDVSYNKVLSREPGNSVWKTPTIAPYAVR